MLPNVHPDAPHRLADGRSVWTILGGCLRRRARRPRWPRCSAISFLAL